MLAIHSASGPFSAGWVAYCREHRVPYKEVNCFSSDIIAQLQGCTMLMWHWEHHDYLAALFARQLIASVEKMGIRVFPSLQTCWHYDDKLGQKYLLEGIGAPLIPSHVFFDRKTALAWLEQAEFPLVWKLRSGAASQNVRLVRDLAQARRIVRRSFGKGWTPNRLYALRRRLWEFRAEPGLLSFVNIARGVARAIFPHDKDRKHSVERNYVYFQDFIPDNIREIRLMVIGGRVFGYRRKTRPGDFRASYSGVHDKHGEVPEDCLRLAFGVAKALGSQCCAFDLIWHSSGWKIAEISYAFPADAGRHCAGWWDPELKWHEAPVRPEVFMIEDMLAGDGESRG